MMKWLIGVLVASSSIGLMMTEYKYANTMFVTIFTSSIVGVVLVVMAVMIWFITPPKTISLKNQIIKDLTMDFYLGNYLSPQHWRDDIKIHVLPTSLYQFKEQDGYDEAIVTAVDDAYNLLTS